jgi:hypothetical protein
MHAVMPIVKTTTITRPTPKMPKLSSAEITHEREVYSMDPTGGSASSY